MSAVEKYLKQVEEEPTNAEAWYKLGDAYFHAEQYEDALDAFEEASLIDPHNAALLYRIGDVAYSLELYEEAIKALLKALEITSDNAAIWCRLGDAYLASGENNQYYDPVLSKTTNFYDNDDDFFYAQAISFYEKALALEPASEVILKGLINSCSKLKVFYLDQEPENEDMRKTLNRASLYLAQHGADSMVHQKKLSVPQIRPERQEEYFLSFEAMIGSWLMPRAKTKRNVDIFMHRMGWLGEGSKTLEIVGTIYGVTRERVRQIEAMLMAKIRKKSAINELAPFWSAINVIVESLGVLDLDDLGQQLMNYFKWDSKPLAEGIENIISLHPEPTFTLAKEGSNRYLILKNLKCIECNPISEYLVTCLSGGQISMTSAISVIDLFCKAKCNQKHLIISSTFIRYMTANNEYLSAYLKAEQDMLYTIDYWNLIHGRLLAAAEAILKLKGRAMHFTEIAEALSQIKGNEVPARNIHASLDRSEHAVLWGRGTFIHNQHVPFSYRLINEIEKWIESKLMQHIPLVSVYGAFKAFHQDCLNAGIPNEVALYSCLRMSAAPKLNYPDYPYIFLSEDSRTFSSLSVIEKFIRDEGGPITLEKLRRYAIDDLGLKEFQLINALDKNADILRCKKGKYLHKDYLDIEEDKMDEITSYIKNILLTQPHVSVDKIFHDKIIDCKLMGINEPILLFSLLQQYTDDLLLSNYPQIYSADLNDRLRNKGIMNEIVDHIKSKKAFCSYQELYEVFVDELGYSKNTVYFALNNNIIYRYLQGCVIHEETLGWTETKQAQLEQIASGVYEEALNLGQFYGLIPDIIESSDLPNLDNNVDWTELLISELLEKHNNFKIIGNAKKVFVPTINSKHIESFEDLICEILKSRHKGAANLNDFTEELVDMGIVFKGITKSMLGESKKVCIAGQEIILTELMRNA